MAPSCLVLTAVFDGPLSGGHPKGCEVFATCDIADLSEYGLGFSNNGGGLDGEEFTFPAEAATAGAECLIRKAGRGNRASPAFAVVCFIGGCWPPTH